MRIFLTKTLARYLLLFFPNESSKLDMTNSFRYLNRDQILFNASTLNESRFFAEKLAVYVIFAQS